MSDKRSESRNRPSANRTQAARPQAKKVDVVPVRRQGSSQTGRQIQYRKQKKEPAYAPARKRFVLFGHEGDIDMPFFITILILLVFGIIMMFSAGYFWALREFNDGYHYLKQQLVAAVFGFVMMYALSKVDYHFLQHTKVAYFSFLAVLAINIYTAFFGIERAGAKRWIVIGPINFQPSEIMKITLIIVFAYLLAANYPKFNNWRYSVLPCVVILGAVSGAALLQRHVSALLIMGAIGIVMLFVGGIPKKHFFTLVAAVAAAGVLFLLYKMATSTGEDAGFGYIANRLEAWRNPESDILDSTNQIHNSLIAIGSGGVFGVGLGESKQKFLWLSEAQNDFVFSIVCEELGLIGALFVVALFCFFIYRGFHIASRSKDRFGMLLAVGITMQIGLQALLNIAVATNTIPNTGISLPFFSYGGTALVIQLVEMGVLLSISRDGY